MHAPSLEIEKSGAFWIPYESEMYSFLIIDNSETEMHFSFLLLRAKIGSPSHHAAWIKILNPHLRKSYLEDGR